jgi:hypothetical protein
MTLLRRYDKAYDKQNFVDALTREQRNALIYQKANEGMVHGIINSFVVMRSMPVIKQLCERETRGKDK